MRASGRGAGCRSPGCGVQPDGGRVRLHQDRLARRGAGRGGAGQGWAGAGQGRAGRPCRGCAAGFSGPRGAGSLGWPASGFRGGQMGGPLTSQGAGVSWLRCHLPLPLCVPGGPASERGSASRSASGRPQLPSSRSRPRAQAGEAPGASCWALSGAPLLLSGHPVCPVQPCAPGWGRGPLDSPAVRLPVRWRGDSLGSEQGPPRHGPPSTGHLGHHCRSRVCSPAGHLQCDRPRPLKAAPVWA